MSEVLNTELIENKYHQVFSKRAFFADDGYSSDSGSQVVSTKDKGNPTNDSSDDPKQHNDNQDDDGYGSDSGSQVVSTKDKGNPTNDSSNDPKQHNDNQDDDGYGSDSDNQAVSTKDKGNPTNDSSNDPKQRCPDRNIHNDEAPYNNNQTISTESSDCNTEENSGCSLDVDYPFLKDSLLIKLEILLTTSEKTLISDFCKGIRDIAAQQEPEESILENIEKVVDNYLEQGIRLNSGCSNENDNEKGDTVASLVLEEIENVLKLCDETRACERQHYGIANQDDDNEDKVSGIIKSITSKLLLKGGKARQEFFFGNTKLAQNYGFNYINDLSEKCKKFENELIIIACEGIVNKSKQIHEYDFEAEIDNKYFYIKYPQDSIIEPAKILNNEKAKKLNLKVGILQIGENIVRIEKDAKGKRNYVDVLKGGIEMFFATEVGKISICLYRSKENSDEVKVEFANEESKARFNKLKIGGKSLGENCLLGGKSVLEAIEDKGFERNKDVPSTDLMQPHLQQKEKTKEKY